MAAEVGPSLGLWPQDKPAWALAEFGFVANRREEITFYVTFKHCDAGLPALVGWLKEQGCTDFRYGLRGSPRMAAGAEEE